MCLLLAANMPAAAQQLTLLTSTSGDSLTGMNASSDLPALSNEPAHGCIIDSVHTFAALHSRSAPTGSAKSENTPDWLLSLNDNGLKADSSRLFSGRDPFRISQIVNEHNDEIQAIYQRYLKRWPDLEGKLTVRIFISPTGAVERANLAESTLRLRPFENEVLKAIVAWRDFGACPDEPIKIFRQQYIFGD